MEYLFTINSYRNNCFIPGRCNDRNTDLTLNRDVFMCNISLRFYCGTYFIKWEHFTGGNRGLPVPQPEFLGMSFYDSVFFYYICLIFLIAAMFAAINILRSPTGRAFVAIRDSEIAAQSLGVNLGLYKVYHSLFLELLLA